MKLAQHGGEGTGSYSGKAKNKSLSQLGGEGTAMKMGGESKLLKPDCGPGSDLSISK